jgi:3-oxoadipate enol-lactonase
MAQKYSGFAVKRTLGYLLVGGVLALSLTLPAAAASSPAFKTNWIRANGVSLRYELSGRGPSTIVLLHEASMGLESWDYVAPALARTHQVLRYDMRGYGLSQAIRGPITLADHENDLRELLKALNINGKVNVVGTAVGGAVALKFAADNPDLVAQVMAISPAAYLQGQTMQGRGGGGPGGPPGAAPAGLPGGAAPAGAPGSTPAAAAGAPVNMEATNDGAYPTRFREADPVRYARFKALEGSSAGSGGQATMGAIYSTKYAEVLPTIRVPAVVVATSLWIRPVAEYKALADAIPNSKFEVIESGHFAAMATPDLVTAVIKKYVK